MSTKATEIMGLIGEASWMDLFLQLDQAFFKLREPVQAEIWRRIMIMINHGTRDPGELAKAANKMISSVEVIK